MKETMYIVATWLIASALLLVIALGGGRSDDPAARLAAQYAAAQEAAEIYLALAEFDWGHRSNWLELCRSRIRTMETIRPGDAGAAMLRERLALKADAPLPSDPLGSDAGLR